MVFKYLIKDTGGVHYRWMAVQYFDWFHNTPEEREEAFLEMEEWCVNHLDGNLTWYADSKQKTVYFADEDAVLAFKMRWG